MTSAEPVPSSGTEAATRVADVLLLFLSGPAALGVSEISRQLNLSKTVVHRILKSLEARGLVAFNADDRNYSLGPGAEALGARALSNLELRRIALPVLRRLQHDTGETTTVSELLGMMRIYLDQVPSLKEIKMTVELGRPFPLHAGASGRVILAFAPPGLREFILEGSLPALTPLTPTDVEELTAGLSRIREVGTAASYGEREHGAGSVAAPVLGPDGHALGSISACGPVDRFDEEAVERMRPLVLDAARDISRVMSGETAEGGGRSYVDPTQSP